MTPTQEQIDNRRKLIAYLRGELKAEFNMARFCENYGLTPISVREECGSVGCAIGHGPYAGIKKNSNENWYGYSERVFGIRKYTNLWDYCFDSAWINYDNTAIGAADRLEEITDNNFTDQQLRSMFPW